jgi:phosphopantetheinyl transferase
MARDGLSPAAATRVERALDTEHQRRLAAITTAGARQEFLAGRALVGAALAEFTGQRTQRWRLETTAIGKPRLVNQRWAAEIAFNLGHAAGVVGCAVVAGAASVSLDLQATARPLDADALAARFFAPPRTAAVPRMRPWQRRLRSPACGILKKTFLEARGIGITVPTRDVVPALSPLPRLFSPAADDFAFVVVQRFGFTLAVAFERRGGRADRDDAQGPCGVDMRITAPGRRSSRIGP